MKKTNISVIIPAYNEEKYIEKCIESVKNQKTNLKYEIIVVNNNSTDNTSKIAKKYKVKLLDEKKQGVGAARRTGTQNAKGEIIIHIDADTRLFPNHFEKVWGHFKKDKELACLGGQFIFYDANFIQRMIRKILYKPTLFLAKISTKGALGPTGGNMAFKINTYKKTKGFNPKLNFGEDADITLQLKKFGKVKVDLNLKCEVSVRRYKMDKKTLQYCLNFFSFCFRKKPSKNILPKS